MGSMERLARAPEGAVAEREGTLKGRRHDEDRIHLLVRDPRSLFALWEISSKTARSAEERAVRARVPLRYQLQVERREREGAPESIVGVVDLADALGGEGWYVDLPVAGGLCRAHIGHEWSGSFLPLLSSRWVSVPPEGPCAEEGPWDVSRESDAELNRYFARAVATPGSPRPGSMFGAAGGAAGGAGGTRDGRG